MLINIIKITLASITTAFLVVIYNHYFSINNLELIKKNRKEVQNENYKLDRDLPILTNDTSNIVEFHTGFDDPSKKSFKRNFWELFK